MICGLKIWHEWLVDDPNDVRDPQEVAELAHLEGTASNIHGYAGLNASALCFLEIGGKLRFDGEVESHLLGGTEMFSCDVDVRDVILQRGFVPVGGTGSPGTSKAALHYRLQQLPYAAAYDWIQVSFEQVELPVQQPSWLPHGADLLLEAYVNSVPAGYHYPFRRQFYNHPADVIRLEGWTYDVVYPEDDIASELTLVLRATWLDPDPPP